MDGAIGSRSQNASRRLAWFMLGTTARISSVCAGWETLLHELLTLLTFTCLEMRYVDITCIRSADLTQFVGFFLRFWNNVDFDTLLVQWHTVIFGVL